MEKKIKLQTPIETQEHTEMTQTEPKTNPVKRIKEKIIQMKY